jgi:TolB-like protein
MKKIYSSYFIGIIAILAFVIFGLASASTPQPASEKTVSPSQQQNVSPSSQSSSASSSSTGNDGKGMSIAILAPKATGLAENQSYLPALVQGEFVSNFSSFSAISVLDRERLDEQYAELLSGYYADDDAAALDLGHLKATDYIQTGSITRTATGYALQIQITRTADKMTTASYSGTFTFAELDNLTGIRKASLELVQKMGVALTAQAREQLAGAATENQVQAQTALARGIAAQRQGTEVAALSYYFQAAAYDPSLMEAASRFSILNTSIISGNIGDDVRSDIQWRRDWVARLTETEQFFDSFNRTESMPYTLFYTSDIKQIGNTDYRNETATLGGIETHLHGSGIWTVSMERALQAVYDGLQATKRADVWGLSGWPRQGVTNLNYTGRRQNFAIVFEILNNQNKVIGRQALQSGGSWGINRGGRPVVSVNADDRKTVNFQNVNANDITDRMTIRIATVNGTDAETAARNGVLQMRAITKNELSINDQWQFSKGEIQGFRNNSATAIVIPDTIWGDPVIFIGSEAFQNNNITSITVGANVVMSSNSFRGDFQYFSDSYNQNGKKAGTYNRSMFRFVNGREIQGFSSNADKTANPVIPDTIWGNPVKAIGPGAFKNAGLTSVDISNNVITIGNEAFADNKLASVTNGNNVTFIGSGAFKNAFDNSTRFSLTIPNSVTSIGEEAFSIHNSGEWGPGDNEWKRINSITIGENVAMAYNSFRYSWRITSGGSVFREGIDNNGFYEAYAGNGKKAGIYECQYLPNGLSLIPTIFKWRSTTLPVNPPKIIGTWKRQNNTLTFTSNMVASNQWNIWKLITVQDGLYTYTIVPDTDAIYWVNTGNKKKTIRLNSSTSSLEISEDRDRGNDNWNGTWKKQ